jgi:hypothetical protein
VTITTVGYGDRFPVTNTGRIIGIFVMIAGVGLFVYNIGSYQPVTPNTIALDGTQFLGRVNPSGTQVSALWGTVTFHDY